MFVSEALHCFARWQQACLPPRSGGICGISAGAMPVDGLVGESVHRCARIGLVHRLAGRNVVVVATVSP